MDRQIVDLMNKADDLSRADTTWRKRECLTSKSVTVFSPLKHKFSIGPHNCERAQTVAVGELDLEKCGTEIVAEN
jgi:hypothetical protein